MTSSVQAIFMIDSPKLEELEVVVVTVGSDSATLSQIQGTTLQAHILRCREFIYTDADVIGYPSSNNSQRQFCLIFKKEGSYYKKLLSRLKKMDLLVSNPFPVDHFTYSQALQYTIQTRLAPQWNKLGYMLLQGRNFAFSEGKTNAIEMDINMGDDGLKLVISGSIVNFPKLKLNDLGIPNQLIEEFSYYPRAVIPQEAIPNKWILVLPSLKKGIVASIRRTVPLDSPFETYLALKRHWKNHYGYRLPDEESQIFYVQIQFQRNGRIQFTYPSCCIRSSPPTSISRTDSQPILHQFLSDLHSRMPRLLGRALSLLNSTAGFPTRDFRLGTAIMATQKFSTKSCTITAAPNITRKVPSTMTGGKIGLRTHIKASPRLAIESFSSQPTISDRPQWVQLDNTTGEEIVSFTQDPSVSSKPVHSSVGPLKQAWINSQASVKFNTSNNMDTINITEKLSQGSTQISPSLTSAATQQLSTPERGSQNLQSSNDIVPCKQNIGKHAKLLSTPTSCSQKSKKNNALTEDDSDFKQKGKSSKKRKMDASNAATDKPSKKKSKSKKEKDISVIPQTNSQIPINSHTTPVTSQLDENSTTIKKPIVDLSDEISRMLFTANQNQLNQVVPERSPCIKAKILNEIQNPLKRHGLGIRNIGLSAPKKSLTEVKPQFPQSSKPENVTQVSSINVVNVYKPTITCSQNGTTRVGVGLLRRKGPSLHKNIMAKVQVTQITSSEEKHNNFNAQENIYNEP